jgi:GNAT superfamily N-acetyltransferase
VTLDIDVRPVRTTAELTAILELQRANHAVNVSAAEAAEQGFVTVAHDLALLEQMHAIAPSIAAFDRGELAGYALVMPIECRALVPVLVPMFDRLDALGVRRYYIMGQICISKSYRGRGVFDALYAGHRAELASRYARCVTEIATRNTRSMRAHERVGFRIIDTYRDATDEWALVSWDWRAASE